MLSNVLQKPLGMVAVLATAVGGPYAAFETELGTSIRRSLMAATSNGNANPNGRNPQGDVLPGAADPYSLLAANQNSNMPNWQGGGSSSSYPTTASPSGNAQNNSSWNNANANWNNTPNSAWGNAGTGSTQGQLVSTVYGPTTVTNLDPNGMNGLPMQSYQSNLGGFYPSNIPGTNPVLENRSGPASVVSGGTDKLWDYTLGAPSLPQIQQQQPFTGSSVGGGTVNDLREVLRFDIVPGWLPTRFARVTTITSNVQMDGLRVPLVTGTQSKDIAGTLTYFFDASQSLKRINLHGLTGDPSQLANLMVQYYQLKPEQSLGGQLFTARWNNRVTSVMQVSPAPIIYAGADHSKYIIFLELNQPSNQYGLSDEASEILRTSQATKGW